MTIYISGQITGNENYICDFINAELYLKKEYKGSTIINPIELTKASSEDWEYYMRIDLRELLNCNAIYMLKGWEQSRGATLEHTIAEALGMNIIYER